MARSHRGQLEALAAIKRERLEQGIPTVWLPGSRPRWRLWPLRIWFGRETIDPARKRLYVFYRRLGERGTSEVRGERFWATARGILRRGSHPRLHRFAAVPDWLFGAAYVLLALHYATAPGGAILSAIWMSGAFVWFAGARSKRKAAG